MRHLLLRSLLLLIALVVSLGFYRVTTSDYVSREASDHVSLASQVLGVADSIENMFFKVAIPATFEDTVTFKKPINAPDLITALSAGDGITITNGEIPRITNTGVLELVAGTGISVDGNKITSTITQGYTSLSAGTNISIDGNKITNTYTAPTPDYTQSGWTTGTGKVYLTTITNSVGIGTTAPTSLLHVIGSSNLSGNVILGEDSGDTITINAGMLAGSSITPQVDLGADLGTSLKRFNNLYVANINSNSGLTTAGQAIFTYSPTTTLYTASSVLINPTAPLDQSLLLGLGVAGYERAGFDEDGDLTLGYLDAISAPTSDYPLNIYGHSGTRVSYIDTSGNLYMGTGLSSSGALTVTPSAGTNLNVALSTTGDFAVNTNQLYVDTSTGYVGIGTTAPSDIFTTFTSSNPYIKFSAAGGTNIGKLSIGGTDTATNRIYLSGTWGDQLNYVAGGNSAAGYGHVFRVDNTLTEIMRIDGNSRVGIKDTTPDGTLEIVKNSTDALLMLSSAESTNGDYLYVGNTGLVGIGTTNPGYKLEVTGGQTLAKFGSSSDYVSFYNTTTNEMALVTGASDTLQFMMGGIDTANIKMVVKSDGSVGIGTTAPATQLHITGELRAPKVNKVVVVDGTTYAQTCAGINAALTALGSGGGEVYLPEGDYTCAEQVLIQADKTYIRGAGDKTNIVSTGLANNTINIHTRDYITLENFRITHTGTGGYSEIYSYGSASLNDYTGTSYSRFANLTIDSTNTYCMTFRYAWTNTVIEDNNLRTCNVAFYELDSGDNYNIFRNNFMENNPSAYSSVQTGGNYWTITGNSFKKSSGSYYGLYHSGNYSTISNNVFVNGGMQIAVGRNNTITGNYIERDLIHGIRMISSTSYNLIANNTFKGTSAERYGISIESGNYNSIKNNYFTGYTNATGDYGTVIKIAAGATSNDLSDNYFENNRVDIADAGTSTRIQKPTGTNLAIGLLDNTPDATLEIIKQSTSPLLMLSSSADANGDYFYVGNTGNVGIGTSSFGTDAAKVLSIGGSTAPTTAITDGVQLYAVDVAGSHELKVMDEAGNATTLSPHNFSLIPSGPSEELAWSYYSERDGLAINADMTKALRIVESLSGEKIIYQKDLLTGLDIDSPVNNYASASAEIKTVESTLLAKIESLIASLKESITSVSGYFTEIFSSKSHQKELCVGETTNEICLTKDQVEGIVKLLPTPTPSPTPTPDIGTPAPVSTDSATPSATNP